jgi:DNA-binding response OmpR family regulator
MTTLLLVDDDADQLAMRAMVLERAGYKVLVAAEVAGALAYCEFDVLIMDLIEDYLSLIASIGSRPIIVLTGRGTVPDLPVARILRKPCPTRVLLATIAELV